jgi:hypothetical protein
MTVGRIPNVEGGIQPTLLTTAGDIMYASSASNPARLGIGTASQILAVNSGATAPEWVAAPSSGMTLISATTIGSAVASVTVTGAFSATYDNYKIIITGGSASADNFFQLTLGATTTGYYYAGQFVTYANVASTAAGSNAAFYFAGNGQSSGLQTDIDVYNPFLSDETAFVSRFPQLRTGGSSGYVAGYLNNTTSYTAFTITPSTGTLTGGTIRVYGLRNS